MQDHNKPPHKYLLKLFNRYVKVTQLSANLLSDDWFDDTLALKSPGFPVRGLSTSFCADYTQVTRVFLWKLK